MNDQNYTTTITVDQSPDAVFAAINNVRGWWTGDPGVAGSTAKLGAEFSYQYGDVHYSKQQITELIPGKRIVWLVTEAKLNFTKDPNEWKGTKITFDIAKKGNGTEVCFTHVGLVPAIQCYGDCSGAWGFFMNESLKNLINKGVDMEQNRIEKYIDLKSSPAKVWKALTDYKEFGQWFGCNFEGPFMVGKTIPGTLSFPGFEHMQWAIDVKKLEHERAFAFTWHPYPADPTIDYTKETPTLVEFTLTASGSGTHLVVTETGFDKIPANRRLEAFRTNTDGWVVQLENLAKYVG